jgi:hypothetical protein
VAWALAYAYKTFQENKNHTWGFSEQCVKFSPSFVYNQINAGLDRGARISDAMDLLRTQGCCPLSDMPYDSKNFTKKPDNRQSTSALGFKAKEWNTVSTIEDFKKGIVETGGVVIGIPVCQDFHDLNYNNAVYDTAKGPVQGYHAICLIGYDNNKQAFKLINSWGTEWGLGGYGWIDYGLMREIIETYESPGYVMTDDEPAFGTLSEMTFGAGTSASVSLSPRVFYQSHTQNIGWMDYVMDGQTAGTTGQSLRLEALKMRLENAPENASIEYHVFADGPGWTPWAVNDAVSGTTGESRQVEAVEIRLSHLPGYSVSYRAHVQNKGWLDWVADGQAAGSPGSGLRLEAVEIKVVEKK